MQVQHVEPRVRFEGLNQLCTSLLHDKKQRQTRRVVCHTKTRRKTPLSARTHCLGADRLSFASFACVAIFLLTFCICMPVVCVDQLTHTSRTRMPLLITHAQVAVPGWHACTGCFPCQQQCCRVGLAVVPACTVHRGALFKALKIEGSQAAHLQWEPKLGNRSSCR